MKKYIVVFLIIIFNLNLYSQISFENGYYIDNFNQKIECIIKNLDWKNNPTGFEFKLSKESETKVAEIKYIKEFGIYNTSKFIRSAIKIDKSGENINNLDYDRNPVFIEEVLFLKVLVEGKANLYIYEKESLKRYFYSTDNSDIEQLIFKVYLDVENKILTNNTFKNQLWTDLKCPKIEIDKVENLEYKTKSLINFFISYNKCNNLEFINYDQKVKKDLFNLTFRIHLNNSSLSIENNALTSNVINFGYKTSFGFGGDCLGSR